MRLGLDLDNCIYPFAEVFTDYVNHIDGETFDATDIVTWDFYKEWGYDDRSFRAMLEQGCRDGIVFHDGDPTAGSWDALSTLQDAGHTVTIITDRQPYAQKPTADWLALHEVPCDAVVLTPDKHLCGMDVILDDAPHQIKAAQDAGIRAIIWDQPWNRHVQGERVFSWPDFVSAINDLSCVYDRALPSTEVGYVTKDSGDRAVFESGMQRDIETGKPRFDLLLPHGVPYDQQFMTRVAALLARGAAKYDDRNWERADGTSELARFQSSAMRHFFQWMAGEVDEDHAAAVTFNLLAYETTKYKMLTDTPPIV